MTIKEDFSSIAFLDFFTDLEDRLYPSDEVLPIFESVNLTV